ncbi:MAG: hypothetical protein M3P70_10275 [Actinomycetota bacterium]|nr:hypothetical protein [Actinomycetota bacterium]
MRSFGARGGDPARAALRTFSTENPHPGPTREHHYLPSIVYRRRRRHVRVWVVADLHYCRDRLEEA